MYVSKTRKAQLCPPWNSKLLPYLIRDTQEIAGQGRTTCEPRSEPWLLFREPWGELCVRHEDKQPGITKLAPLNLPRQIVFTELAI